MLAWVLMFLAGIVSATRLAQLPSQGFMAGIWAVSILLCLGLHYARLPKNLTASGVQRLKPVVRGYRITAQLLIAFLLGLGWCLWQLVPLVKFNLPTEWIAKSLTVTGTIVSLPEIRSSQTRFEFLIDDVKPPYQITHPIRVILSDHVRATQTLLPFQVGERWQLTVRLRQPRSFWNPGSFDYQAWLLQQRIQATGTIVRPTAESALSTAQMLKPQRLEPQMIKRSTMDWPQRMVIAIHRFRAQIAQEVSDRLSGSSITGLLNALVTGVRYEISEAQWKVMRATGTNHLFAIAGLHIGFIAGMVYRLINRLWRHLGSLPLYLPAQQAAQCVAVLAAAIYSLLSGFALPTQRAVIMFAGFIGVTLRRRILAPWRTWCLALLIILWIDPLVVLTESFWLSFVAVAIIFYGTGGRLPFGGQTRLQRLWQHWGRTQWVISIGLLPLSLLFFQQIALAGFIANLIAIPWTGFLVLPVSLLGALLGLGWPAGGSALLVLGEKLLFLLWQLLSYIASFPGLQGYTAIGNSWILLTTSVATALYLAPRGFPGRYYLGSLWLLPLLLWKPAVPAEREIWVTLLDVGQGLAAVVQTQKHTLIYDTGPRFGPHFDTGHAVILPFIRAKGLHHIDTLLVSHVDNDHSGGAQSLLSQLPIKQVLASQPEKLKSPLSTACYRGQQWVWEGVQFEILHPDPGQPLKGNDNSCVLRISNGVHSVLLPGDIHKRGERVLLATGLDLSASLLIAPHHGSKTSSSEIFIQAIKPRYVLFPVGYRNRFNFPHPLVLSRYYQQGAHAYSTAEEGAITVKLGVGPASISITSYREQALHFWQIVP